MKKILFLAGTLAVIFACSTENETEFNQDQNQPTEKVAARTYSASEVDEMFYEYVNSEEFINSRNATLDFNSKLGSLQLPNSFDNEDQFYSWINVNIAETSFVNMTEVQTKWNHIKFLTGKKRTKFGPVYEFMKNAPIDLVKTKIIEWFPGRNIGTNSDPCLDDFINCNDAADDRYISRMNYISDVYGGYPQSIDFFESGAYSTWEMDAANCRDNYSDCVNG